jgi:hypothetical protein
MNKYQVNFLLRFIPCTQDLTNFFMFFLPKLISTFSAYKTILLCSLRCYELHVQTK